jgi:ABC-type Fe3+-hydroxamate transport system substrate-binding protein
MLQHTDQLGNSITLHRKPKRVISLVPSQSEFLWDIGIRDLVGVTKFCVHPPELFGHAERVGGTKKLDLDKIRRLKPDIIIGNKEENAQDQIEILQREFPVWMSDIYDFEDAFNMMSALGKIFQREAEAAGMVERIRRSLGSVHTIFKGQRTAYFIWKDPYMLAATNTFIDHVLNFTGLKNALSHMERYPELDDSEIIRLKPDFCFLSSEPYPFREKHAKELKEKLPGAKIVSVDGEMFSWYGSRMLRLESYIHDLKKKLDD